MAAKEPKPVAPGPDRIAHATFALLAADRDERANAADTRNSETVLAAAGFTVGEVHGLIGGNRKTIESRMRRAK
ncbi:MAG TPA: hypothetical protein VHT29_07485 [Solirubrobacteraceae bacterium]|jgi:hypothetical protein|nr:hypothetical protein [Solirubrobacteraceae bacterium]